jgi:eukaryotic-like serine/threonine-protein kinase
MGIVLYKMLVGGLPFPPDTPAGLATRIMLGNLPSPGEARAGIPPMLDMVFSRATARDPQMRYASWEDFAADLRSVSAPDGEDANERIGQLRNLPFFKDFGDAALTELVPMGRWFDVRAGSQLVGEDDPGYSFFVLVRGQVRVTRKGTLLAIRGAGECLERPRSCAAPAPSASAPSRRSPTAP